MTFKEWQKTFPQSPADPKGARQLDGRDRRVVHVRPGSRRSATALHQASSGSSIVRQDAVTRDRRYGPLMAKRSEGRKEGIPSDGGGGFHVDLSG